MDIHSEPQSAAARQSSNFSPRLRTALGMYALILAVLPIPITLLGLLPTYRMHARFLVFYVPLICLLILGYCLYTRDILARAVLTDFLHPPPESNPFYPDSFAVRLHRGLAHLRTGVVRVFPLGLLALSFFSIARYATALNQSVTIALVGGENSPPDTEEIGLALDSMPTFSGAQVDDTPGGTGRVPRVGPVGLARTNVFRADSPEARRHALQSTGIHEIPRFAELTVLYIGIFVGALGAIIVMWLREYAKAAMGLSEQDLVLGAAREPYE